MNFEFTAAHYTPQGSSLGGYRSSSLTGIPSTSSPTCVGAGTPAIATATGGAVGGAGGAVSSSAPAGLCLARHGMSPTLTSPLYYAAGSGDAPLVSFAAAPPSVSGGGSPSTLPMAPNQTGGNGNGNLNGSLTLGGAGVGPGNGCRTPPLSSTLSSANVSGVFPFGFSALSSYQAHFGHRAVTPPPPPPPVPAPAMSDALALSSALAGFAGLTLATTAPALAPTMPGGVGCPVSPCRSPPTALGGSPATVSFTPGRFSSLPPASVAGPGGGFSGAPTPRGAGEGVGGVVYTPSSAVEGATPRSGPRPPLASPLPGGAAPTPGVRGASASASASASTSASASARPVLFTTPNPVVHFATGFGLGARTAVAGADTVGEGTACGEGAAATAGGGTPPSCGSVTSNSHPSSSGSSDSSRHPGKPHGPTDGGGGRGRCEAAGSAGADASPARANEAAAAEPEGGGPLPAAEAAGRPPPPAPAPTVSQSRGNGGGGGGRSRRSSGSRPADAPTRGAPPQKGPSTAAGQSGRTVEVYDSDFKDVLTIPVEQVWQRPHPSLGVSRLVLCRNCSPAHPDACTKGDMCKFVHADTTGATRCSIHVNYAWRRLDLCTYPRLAEGEELLVLAPNERPPVETLPSERVLVTKGSLGRKEHPTPLSHCAHYYFNRMCNRGERCNFIHAVCVDPTVQGDFKRAPAPTAVAPIVAGGTSPSAHGRGLLDSQPKATSVSTTATLSRPVSGAHHRPPRGGADATHRPPHRSTPRHGGFSGAALEGVAAGPRASTACTPSAAAPAAAAAPPPLSGPHPLLPEGASAVGGAGGAAVPAPMLTLLQQQHQQLHDAQAAVAALLASATVPGQRNLSPAAASTQLNACCPTSPLLLSPGTAGGAQGGCVVGGNYLQVPPPVSPASSTTYSHASPGVDSGVGAAGSSLLGSAASSFCGGTSPASLGPVDWSFYGELDASAWPDPARGCDDGSGAAVVVMTLGGDRPPPPPLPAGVVGEGRESGGETLVRTLADGCERSLS